jgi:hypothetical protein
MESQTSTSSAFPLSITRSFNRINNPVAHETPAVNITAVFLLPRAIRKYNLAFSTGLLSSCDLEKSIYEDEER